MFERHYSFGSVTAATEADIPLLADRLREADLVELRKFANLPPDIVLRMSLKNAKFAYCLREPDGTPVSIIGLGRRADPRSGVAWFLSTDKLDKVGLLFLQETRALIDTFMEGHDVISNFVYSGNEKSVKWLKWLGFEVVAETSTRFSDGELFYEMARFKDDAAKASFVSATRAFAAVSPKAE